jgi:hypothetical protein
MNNTALPLHPAQYEVYIDQVLNSESPHYNIGLFIKLKGFLDKEKFHEAVNSSSEVFDIFRMRFDFDASVPVCFFNNSSEKVELTEIDFSDRESPETEAKNWMQNRFNTPFVLQNETLLFEHVLIKVSSTENWFFFRYHHLITDGLGFTIWVNYLAQKYKSLLKGDNVQFEYPFYKDAVVKASEYRRSPWYETDGKYWKDKIGEKREALLRKNSSFTTKSVKKSGNYYFNISREQRNVLEELIRVTKANLGQLTIAALAIYFRKTSEQNEFMFGIPVHKRGSGAPRNTAGMFSGVLPFKSKLTEDIKLSDLLKSIASSRRQDYPHQNYLIVDLIKSLKITASESFLYDVIINYVPFNFLLDLVRRYKQQYFGCNLSMTNFHCKWRGGIMAANNLWS